MNKFLVMGSLVLFSMQSFAGDKAMDEAACAKQKVNLESQASHDNTKIMTQAILKLLIEAYKGINVTITEAQIQLKMPTHVFKDDPSTEGYGELTTEIPVSVSAGKDSIEVKAISVVTYVRGADRENKANKIGRVTGTKLICSLSSTYAGTEVINVASGLVIGTDNQMINFDHSVELP